MNIFFVIGMVLGCISTLFYITLWRYRIDYKKWSEYSIEKKKIVYDLRVNHWYRADIVRNDFYYNLTLEQIDSIKVFEDSVGNIIKKEIDNK